MAAINPTDLANYIQNVTILNIVKLLTAAILYGVYLILLFCATTILPRREANLKARVRLLAAVVLIFILSSFEFWVAVYTIIRGIQDVLVDNVEYSLHEKSSAFAQRYRRLVSVEQAIIPLEATLGDSIVLWRAWKLCAGDRRAIYLPMLFLLGTTVCSLGFFGCYAQYEWPVVNPETCSSLEISAFSLSMATNILGTIIVGHKVWSYRRDIAVFLSKNKHKTQAEKVLVLVLESGIVYSVLWIIQVVVVLMDPPRTFSGKVVQQIFTSASIQMVGIYPTLLIVLVYLQRSMWDSSGTLSTINETSYNTRGPQGSHRTLISESTDMA
ncbi:hypothetical protein V5O48_014411 [Marasmius crinis-equi]|uniref:Uncharacterized protein n=1 Tax=Marasmius crinis-equi TaxID=585013 RepID=A0ABR3EXE8_9AGAR